MKLKYILIFFISVITLQSCYVGRAYKYRKFNLIDLDKQASIPLPASSSPFIFKYNLHSNYELDTFLDKSLDNTETYAFLVIKNDSIVYEKYFDSIKPTTKLPSFSVAKSFVGTLMRMAVEDSFIKSFDEPITNYLPYLLENDERFKNITIQHVMDMASGIKSNENYFNPFSDVLKLGFTKNIAKKLKHLKIEKSPGKFEYKSVNTQILAAIIESATHKNLQDYFIEKLWLPLGMESEASWNIDSKKNNKVKAFCCINATAKDFAKFGRLYLNNGNWNGKQLIRKEYVENILKVDTSIKNRRYKNQFWYSFYPHLTKMTSLYEDSLKLVDSIKTLGFDKVLSYQKDNKKFYYAYSAEFPYYAEGLLGQFIYVDPHNKTIIVRLGHNLNKQVIDHLFFQKCIIQSNLKQYNELRNQFKKKV